METVYVETTIVSYLVANPSRDALLAAHQQLTRQWWQDQRSAFQCLVSDETLAEVARGNLEQARLRLEALEGLPTLPITAEVEKWFAASDGAIGCHPCGGGNTCRRGFPADLELSAPGQPSFAEATSGAHDRTGIELAGDLHSN
jgi:hypothetical protein